MPHKRSCPRCGGQDIRRTHRRSAWEHLISKLGFYPYSCAVCRNRFLRHRAGVGFLFSMAAVWLVAAAVVGGVAWWLLQHPEVPAAPPQHPPPQALAAAGQMAAALRSQNQQMRGALGELRQDLARLTSERAAVQQELERLRRQLAARPQGRPAREDGKRQVLAARNLRLQAKVEQLRGALGAMTAERTALQRELEQLRGQAAARPLPPRRELVASIPFASGQTKPGGRGRKLLLAAARRLNKQPRLAVVVQGNADATPLGAHTARLYYDNAGLALARALAVFRALRDAGVDPTRMTVLAAGAPAREPEAGRTVGIWLEKPG